MDINVNEATLNNSVNHADITAVKATFAQNSENHATVTAETTFVDSSNAGTGVVTAATFTGSSINNGDVVAKAIFKDSAQNSANITPTVIVFSGTAVNNGTVANAVFEGSARNEGAVENATFLGSSTNLGAISGESVFSDGSTNAANGVGTITGTVTFKGNATNISETSAFAAGVTIQVNNPSGSQWDNLTVTQYTQPAGYFRDGYYNNSGERVAPANYDTLAHLVGNNWIEYNSNGVGSLANGVYDDGTGTSYLFKYGVKGVVARANGYYSDGYIVDNEISPNPPSFLHVAADDLTHYYTYASDGTANRATGYFSVGHLNDGVVSSIVSAIVTSAVDNDLYYSYALDGSASLPTTGYYSVGYIVDGVKTSVSPDSIHIANDDSKYYTYSGTTVSLANGYYSVGYIVDGVKTSVSPASVHPATDDSKYYTYSGTSVTVLATGYYSFGYIVNGARTTLATSILHIAIDDGNYYDYDTSGNAVAATGYYKTEEGVWYDLATMTYAEGVGISRNAYGTDAAGVYRFDGLGGATKANSGQQIWYNGGVAVAVDTGSNWRIDTYVSLYDSTDPNHLADGYGDSLYGRNVGFDAITYQISGCNGYVYGNTMDGLAGGIIDSSYGYVINSSHRWATATVSGGSVIGTYQSGTDEYGNPVYDCDNTVIDGGTQTFTYLTEGIQSPSGTNHTLIFNSQGVGSMPLPGGIYWDALTSKYVQFDQFFAGVYNYPSGVGRVASNSASHAGQVLDFDGDGGGSTLTGVVLIDGVWIDTVSGTNAEGHIETSGVWYYYENGTRSFGSAGIAQATQTGVYYNFNGTGGATMVSTGYYNFGYIVDGVKTSVSPASVHQATDDSKYYTYSSMDVSLTNGYFSFGYILNGVKTSVSPASIHQASDDAKYYTYSGTSVTVLATGYYSFGYIVDGVKTSVSPDSIHIANDDSKYYTYSGTSTTLLSPGYYTFGYIINGVKTSVSPASVHVALDDSKYYTYNGTNVTILATGYYSFGYIVDGVKTSVSPDSIHIANDDSKYYTYSGTSANWVSGYYTFGYIVNGVKTSVSPASIHQADDSKYYTYNGTNVTILTTGHYSFGYIVDGVISSGGAGNFQAIDDGSYYGYNSSGIAQILASGAERIYFNVKGDNKYSVFLNGGFQRNFSGKALTVENNLLTLRTYSNGDQGEVYNGLYLLDDTTVSYVGVNRAEAYGGISANSVLGYVYNYSSGHPSTSAYTGLYTAPGDVERLYVDGVRYNSGLSYSNGTYSWGSGNYAGSLTYIIKDPDHLDFASTLVYARSISGNAHWYSDGLLADPSINLFTTSSLKMIRYYTDPCHYGSFALVGNYPTYSSSDPENYPDQTDCTSYEPGDVAYFDANLIGKWIYAPGGIFRNNEYTSVGYLIAGVKLNTGLTGLITPETVPAGVFKAVDNDLYYFYDSAGHTNQQPITGYYSIGYFSNGARANATVGVYTAEDTGDKYYYSSDGEAHSYQPWSVTDASSSTLYTLTSVTALDGAVVYTDTLLSSLYASSSFKYNGTPYTTDENGVAAIAAIEWTVADDTNNHKLYTAANDSLEAGGVVYTDITLSTPYNGTFRYNNANKATSNGVINNYNITSVAVVGGGGATVYTSGGLVTGQTVYTNPQLTAPYTDAVLNISYGQSGNYYWTLNGSGVITVVARKWAEGIYTDASVGLDGSNVYGTYSLSALFGGPSFSVDGRDYTVDENGVAHIVNFKAWGNTSIGTLYTAYNVTDLNGSNVYTNSALSTALSSSDFSYAGINYNTDNDGLAIAFGAWAVSNDTNGGNLYTNKDVTDLYNAIIYVDKRQSVTYNGEFTYNSVSYHTGDNTSTGVAIYRYQKWDITEPSLSIFQIFTTYDTTDLGGAIIYTDYQLSTTFYTAVGSQEYSFTYSGTGYTTDSNSVAALV